MKTIRKGKSNSIKMLQIHWALLFNLPALENHGRRMLQ